MVSLKEERKLWKKGYRYVVGLDESGRGSLVGPVIAAAVVLNSKFKSQKSKLQFKIQNLKDSKKLSPKKREEFYKLLVAQPAVKWGMGRVSEKVIDKINIKNAAELAMERALEKLKVQSSKLKVDYLIIDGNHVSNLKLKTYNLKLIIKADEKVFSCAVASILAKVTRDRIMRKYHKKYPQYGFGKHKGYATKFHLKILKKYGPCQIHRKTFKGCARCYN